MATVKKAAKKPTVKRAPVKAVSSTKVTRKSPPKQPVMRSFHKAENVPFFTFELTKQTLYWSILCGIVLALGIWVTSINIQVQKIYDQIDATNQIIDQTP